MVNNFCFQRNFDMNGNSFNGQNTFRNSYSSRQPSNINNIQNPINHNVHEVNSNQLKNEHAFHQNRPETEHTYKSLDGKTWATGSDALAANKQYFQELLDKSKNQNN